MDARRRRGGAPAAAGLLLVLVAGCGASGTDADAAVVIGTLAPMTGEAAFLGEGIVDHGARLAIDVANENGGVLGHDVELSSQDDQRRAEATVSGLNALRSEGVTAGIGPTSATIPAVIQQLKPKAPWIVMGSTSTVDSGLDGSHVWRNFASDSQQLPAMLLAAAREGKKRVALAFENNASGQQQLTTAKEAAERVSGIEVVESLLLAPGQASYQTEAEGFFTSNPDAVLWQLTDVTAAGFFRSADQLGRIDGQYFIGTDAALADDLIDLLKPYLGRATFVAVSPTTSGAGRDEFAELYRSKFAGEPAAFSDVGYDAVTLLLLAIEAAGDRSPDAIAEHVTQVAMAPGEKCTWFGQCASLIRQGKDVDFDGALNSLDFNDHHNVISPFSRVVIGADGTTTGGDQAAFTAQQIAEALGAGSR
jgi:ABC-type branched-subunit amino acid transport system substrate-binding protein